MPNKEQEYRRSIRNILRKYEYHNITPTAAVDEITRLSSAHFGQKEVVGNTEQAASHFIMSTDKLYPLHKTLVAYANHVNSAPDKAEVDFIEGVNSGSHRKQDRIISKHIKKALEDSYHGKRMEVLVNMYNTNLDNVDRSLLSQAIFNAMDEYSLLSTQEQPELSGWISVDERLPEEFKQGMSRDVLTLAGTKYAVKSYDFDLGRWNGSLFVTVTHWAPLTEPPQITSPMRGAGQREGEL